MTVEAKHRDAVLPYGGDFDPSGEDIIRDFDRPHWLLRLSPWSGADGGAGRVVRLAPGNGQRHRLSGLQMHRSARETRPGGT
jgi:hypothetical protein